MLEIKLVIGNAQAELVCTTCCLTTMEIRWDCQIVGFRVVATAFLAVLHLPPPSWSDNRQRGRTWAELRWAERCLVAQTSYQKTPFVGYLWPAECKTHQDTGFHCTPQISRQCFWYFSLNHQIRGSPPSVDPSSTKFHGNWFDIYGDISVCAKRWQTLPCVEHSRCLNGVWFALLCYY